jgi:metal-sulfur cluster biosynthetic enzyme
VGYPAAKRPANVEGMDETHRRILGALTNVYDPCCREKGISLVDMGLVHNILVRGRHARVELLLTSGWCPFANRVLTEATERIEELPDVDTVEVEVVWDTAWSTDRLSESARAKLRFLPDPVAVADRGAYIAARLQKGARRDR